MRNILLIHIHIFMARSRKNNMVQNTFKDYFVPIIGWVLILILIYSFLSNDGSSSPTWEDGNSIPTEITFWDVDTEAYIMYAGDKKEKITADNSIYPWETLIVTTGSVWLTPPDGNTINLNKIAELKLEEDGSYNLYSSDAWFELSSDARISMRYANIEAPAGSILSLTQNEAGSTVYVLAGSAKVTNLAWVSTLLIKGQKVSISRLNAASEDIDLASEKSSIDSYFKWSDWFIANEWHITLNKDDVTPIVSGSGSTESETATLSSEGSWATGLYLSFNNLRDEMSVSDSSLNISGKVLSESVSSITINNAQASIVDGTFSLEGLALWSSINDIVVKVYDEWKSILEKEVYSVYSSADWTISPTTTTAPASNQTGGTTYKSDATNFGFTFPSTTWKFSTSSSEVTIRGITTAPNISRVEVNGFELSSFNGSTWRYHAFERFTTLEEWSNQYKIDYYGSDGKIVYTDYFTVVKRGVESPTTTPPVVEIASSMGRSPVMSIFNCLTDCINFLGSIQVFLSTNDLITLLASLLMFRDESRDDPLDEIERDLEFSLSCRTSGLKSINIAFSLLNSSSFHPLSSLANG